MAEWVVTVGWRGNPVPSATLLTALAHLSPRRRLGSQSIEVLVGAPDALTAEFYVSRFLGHEGITPDRTDIRAHRALQG